MADLLGIGTSGLLAFRRALDTTSHNISNVNTEGYSRQSVGLSTRIPQQSGVGYFGQGVQVSDVNRQYDGFLTEQVRVHTASSARLTTYHSLSSEIDNLLADPDAGLAPALEEFFGSVQDVSNDPTSYAARQALLSTGESLVSRFHSTEQRLSAIQDRANSQMRATVDEINQTAQSIADLNYRIALAQGASSGAPNDLLDQRDLLLQRLSEKVSVSTVEQGDGMVNVFIGTGQSLVVGRTTNALGMARNAYDPTKFDVTWGDTGVQVTNLLTGGSLGGITDFQQQVLDPARKSLGQVALALSDTFNEQHRRGTDLNGLAGGDFFSDISTIAAQASAFNDTTSDVRFDAVVTDPSQITTSDYRLDYNSGQYTLTRMSDNQVVGGPTASLTPTPPSFNLSGGLNPGAAVGDVTTLPSFTISDDQGNAHTVDVSFEKSVAGPPNTWNMSVVMDGDPGRYTDTHTVSFDAGGNLSAIDGAPPGAGTLTLASFVPGGRASTMDIGLDVSALDESNSGVTAGSIVDA